MPLAREAKTSFDQGKFKQAEKQYQEILTKSPNNLYSLSNLGVVLFRNGKLKAAELTLKKAIAIAPKDEFTHTTLGIVYYQQSKFDDALSELTKSLAINPKSATAHNYLGITASQKGWQEAAEKEMLAAIEANPEYADAHFNLAVVYSTSQPPAKELARRHYKKRSPSAPRPIRRWTNSCADFSATSSGALTIGGKTGARNCNRTLSQGRRAQIAVERSLFVLRRIG